MKFKPTEAQIHAAEAVFAAMAMEQTIRPIVETYEKAILVMHQFKIAKKWEDKLGTPEVILDPKLSYLLENDDFAIYHEECKQARDAAGLKVEDYDHCPLLVAGHLRIQAEIELLQAISTIPELKTFASANGLSTELRSKAIDMTLKLLSPFCGKSDDILKRLSA